ncbi:ABC exporter membrane fusion protein, DevB family [Synechococcus sp. PCC 7335]|nr:ABC exporter membrane fusion protein, DevB family [Synechococcus sp. PCC 7335]
MNPVRLQLGLWKQRADLTDSASLRWRLLLGLLLLGTGGLAGWQVWQASIQPKESESTIVVPQISTVTALGALEPAGELISITPPTSVQESRIGDLRVSEGDRIEAGQIIAVLDNRDRLEAALRKAEQQVEIARAKQSQIEAGAKSGEVQAQLAEIARIEASQVGDIAAQRATIARIEAEVNNARADFERYYSLYQRGGISASERDTRRLTLTTAEQRLAEAIAVLSRIQTTSQQQLSQARSTLNRIEDVRPVDVSAARAEVQAAIAAVAEAQANLDQAYVKSPVAGQIIEVHARPGETVSSDGIATIGQNQQMMAIAEVYQDDIRKVEIGQSAVVTSPVITVPLQGTVEQIGFQVERQEVVNEDPAANIDAKVVEVHVQLNETASEKVASLSNLQVTVTIQTE